MKMARTNKNVSVKTYCVVVEVVQPVKRIVISVEAENTDGMFISISIIAPGHSLKVESTALYHFMLRVWLRVGSPVGKKREKTRQSSLLMRL